MVKKKHLVKVHKGEVIVPKPKRPIRKSVFMWLKTGTIVIPRRIVEKVPRKRVFKRFGKVKIP